MLTPILKWNVAAADNNGMTATDRLAHIVQIALTHPDPNYVSTRDKLDALYKAR